MADWRNRDTRNHSFRHARGLATLEGIAVDASEELEPDRFLGVEGVNPSTGSATRIVSHGAPPVPESMQSSTDLVGRALEHLELISGVLGLDDAAKGQFVADPAVLRTSGGAAAVHLQQVFRGLRVFQMTRTVAFSKIGGVVAVTGNGVTIPQTLDVEAKIGAAEALMTAARYIVSPPPPGTNAEIDSYGQPAQGPALDLTDFAPKILASFPLPSRPTVFETGPFADHPKAELVVFYSAPDVRLGWEIQFTLAGFTAQYDLIVAADRKDGAVVLFCANTARSMREVFARVYTSRPANDPQDVRTLIPLPRPLADYPAEPVSALPPGFPFGWVDESVTTVSGNSTIAYKGMSTESFSGTVDGDQLRFEPGDAFGDDQQVANLFYYCNFMHDFFFLLGFDEKAGNFQQINFSGDGRGGDPVVARAHSGPVAQTANMIPLADGIGANMNMGLLVQSGRHTALDADIVFHEYTHGVSARLVGGKLDAQSLTDPQSKAMGEGWSDYFALAVQNYSSETERVVIGDWLLNQPNGMRLAAYDENFPKDFGDLSSLIGSHERGAVWCATLMQMTRNLAAVLEDRPRACRISWRMVVDGMKLTPSQPSFLDGRNAIQTALDALGGGNPLTDAELAACRAAAWAAFARFGMGLHASCQGAVLVDIVANYTVPSP